MASTQTLARSIELQYASAFIIKALHGRLGKKESAARFAIVAYGLFEECLRDAVYQQDAADANDLPPIEVDPLM